MSNTLYYTGVWVDFQPGDMITLDPSLDFHLRRGTSILLTQKTRGKFYLRTTNLDGNYPDGWEVQLQETTSCLVFDSSSRIDSSRNHFFYLSANDVIVRDGKVVWTLGLVKDAVVATIQREASSILAKNLASDS